MPSMNLYRQMSTLSKADPLEWGHHRVVVPGEQASPVWNNVQYVRAYGALNARANQDAQAKWRTGNAEIVGGWERGICKGAQRALRSRET